MRLWSLHPKYLDTKGLVALWREALLAQKVLQGETRGYKNHPQLDRFKRQVDPVTAVATFLASVADEAKRREYNFDASKIAAGRMRGRIRVTRGQIVYEWKHLQKKLKSRDAKKFDEVKAILDPEPHPLFTITDGDIEPWEKR